MTEQLSLPGTPERERGRRNLDHYPTPAWSANALLDAISGAPDGYILEPSCGRGRLLDVLKHRYPERRLVGVEVDPERARVAGTHHTVEEADWLTFRPDEAPGWVFGNPPFCAAEEFVWHALDVVRPGGWVTFLLRLGFLASQARAPLYAPGAGFLRLDVLGRRPSFTGDGKTDSYDYGWFTWERGHTGPATVSRLEAA